MPPGRILRIPLFRGFALPTRAPVLPFSGRAAARPRGPSLASDRGTLSRRSLSTSPPPSPTSTNSPPPTTLTGRLKSLIKTHGWYTLGVYAGLSLLDFSLTFAAIYLLGADKVGAVTTRVKEGITETVGWPFPSSPGHDADEGTVPAPHGGGSESIYAIAILAYGIHKTLLFPVRVGLTAAVTPRFVAFLTRRGFVGQGGVRRAVAEAKSKVRSGRSGAQRESSEV